MFRVNMYYNFFVLPVVDTSVGICLTAVSMWKRSWYFRATCGASFVEPWHCGADILNSCNSSKTDILQRYFLLESLRIFFIICIYSFMNTCWCCGFSARRVPNLTRFLCFYCSISAHRWCWTLAIIGGSRK